MPPQLPAAERAPDATSIPRASARWLFPVTWALSLGIALLYLDRGWFRIPQRLDRAGVQVVVVNRRPLFSEPVGADLVAGLQARYPTARQVGRFLVVWKQPTATDTPNTDHP